MGIAPNEIGKKIEIRSSMNTFCILQTTHKIWKKIGIENKKSDGQCEQAVTAVAEIDTPSEINQGRRIHK